MKTLRIGTFETNSSSCHVIQIMNTKDWEDFKAGNLLIKKEPFGEIDEHMEKVVDLCGSASDDYNWTDWFMTIDDFINDFYQNIEENRKEISERFFNWCNDEFFEFRKRIFNYVMDASKKEIIKKILIEAKGYEYKCNRYDEAIDSDLLVKFETPITCEYTRYGDSDEKVQIIYRGFTTGDVQDFFNDYDKLDLASSDSIWGKSFPEFYIYNDEDDGWLNARVTNLVEKAVGKNGIPFINNDMTITIVDRREEC